MPDGEKVIVEKKRNKWLILAVVIFGFFFIIFIISAVVIYIPPEIIAFFILIGLIAFAIRYGMNQKKHKRMDEIYREVAEILYKENDSLSGIDTRPFMNEMHPLGDGKYLVYLNSLGVTFFYDENFGLFGNRLQPLYAVQEGLETSGLFKDVKAKQKAEQQLDALKEKLNIEIKQDGGGT